MKMENFPLSGDVMQAFRFWSKTFGQQMGFINIYNAETTKPETEMEIIENGVSYGKQLGLISECLELVIQKNGIKLQDLSEEEQKVVVRFRDMMDTIRDIKKEGKTEEKKEGDGRS